MTAPTRRGVLLFAAGLPLSLVILAWSPAGWAWAADFAALALAALGLDALLCPSRRSLTLSLSAPGRLYIGSDGVLSVSIAEKRIGRTFFELLAEQRGPANPPEPVAAQRAADGGCHADLALKPVRRGRITIDAIWLRWSGPLGLIGRTWRHPVGREIDVLPDVRGIRSAALEFFASDAIDGIKMQNFRGEGSEFWALRDHAAGLDNRHIDWKRSAKHRRLVSREFRAERNHQIMLAFDTGHLMSEPIEGLARLDHAINAGLLLAWISLRAGDLVGSFAFDATVRQFLPPSRGLPSFPRLQSGSAGLAYHAEETNFTLALADLNARLQRRALVILFTEFIDTTTAELLLDSLQHMANRHAIVFVTLQDPEMDAIIDAPPGQFRAVGEAVVAHDLQRERQIVFQKLERLGVHCLDVPVNGLAVGLVNTYLRIKERGLL